MTDITKRVTELENVVSNLQERVRQSELILRGDPDFGENSGVLPRLLSLRKDYHMLRSAIEELTVAINSLRHEREQDRKAAEIKRAADVRWLKVIGALVGVGALGSGAQAIQFIIALLGG